MIHQEQHTAPGTILNDLLIMFTLVTRTLSILPSVYLSDISNIDLKTIFLLFFTSKLHRQYINDPSTHFPYDSIVNIITYMSTVTGN